MVVFQMRCKKWDSIELEVKENNVGGRRQLVWHIEAVIWGNSDGKMVMVLLEVVVERAMAVLGMSRNAWCWSWLECWQWWWQHWWEWGWWQVNCKNCNTHGSMSVGGSAYSYNPSSGNDTFLFLFFFFVTTQQSNYQSKYRWVKSIHWDLCIVIISRIQFSDLWWNSKSKPQAMVTKRPHIQFHPQLLDQREAYKALTRSLQASIRNIIVIL